MVMEKCIAGKMNNKKKSILLSMNKIELHSAFSSAFSPTEKTTIDRETRR